MSRYDEERIVRFNHTVRFDRIEKKYGVERSNGTSHHVLCSYRTKSLADSLAAHMNALDEIDAMYQSKDEAE